MWTNRVLMCGIDILLCLWAVYLFFFYFDIFFARKRKRYLSVIGITPMWSIYRQLKENRQILS